MSCHRWCRIFKKCIDKIVVLQHMYYFFTLLRRVLMTSKFYYWIWTEKWQRLYYFFIRSLIFSGQDLSIYDNLGPQKYTLLSSGLWNLVTKLSRFCLENKYSEQKVIYLFCKLTQRQTPKILLFKIQFQFSLWKLNSLLLVKTDAR